MPRIPDSPTPTQKQCLDECPDSLCSNHRSRDSQGQKEPPETGPTQSLLQPQTDNACLPWRKAVVQTETRCSPHGSAWLSFLQLITVPSFSLSNQTLGCLGASSFLPFLLLLPLVRPQPSSGPVSRKPGRQSPPWPLYRGKQPRSPATMGWILTWGYWTACGPSGKGGRGTAVQKVLSGLPGREGWLPVTSF